MMTRCTNKFFLGFTSLCCILSSSNNVIAHPSIGIVRDSKGNIYYTDLEQVWRISNNRKSIAVRNVHTHELFIDKNDNLIGENLRYAGDATKKFYHYLWRLNKEGRLEILVPETQAYVRVDFSMSRDGEGNQYYCKFDDSMRLYKRSVTGAESIHTAFDFRGVKFFIQQSGGEIFFSKQNIVYRILPDGTIKIVAKNIGSGSNAMVWGIWQDFESNVYVAVFNDKVIKKIDKRGDVKEYYRSENGWTPANGVFDKNNRLWILEWSDKNAVRAIMMGSLEKKKSKNMLLPLSVGLTVILAMVIGFTERRKQVSRKSKMSS